MGNLRKIFKIATDAVFLLIVLLGVFIILSVFPIPGNYRTFTIQSGSMEPTIKTGSIILVSPQDSYGVGDIITFRNRDLADRPVTHRIIGAEIVDGMILYATQGDANKISDYSKIRYDQIIGKTILTIPYAGYAVSAARKPLGLVVILLIPASTIIYDEMRKIRAVAKEIKVKKKG